jgi:glutathione peroxidase
MTETPLADIALTTLDGRPTTLAELADGAVLVVNVASKCGLTPQYTALEQLAKDYGERGLTVIGVPCNSSRARNRAPPKRSRRSARRTTA